MSYLQKGGYASTLPSIKTKYLSRFLDPLKSGDSQGNHPTEPTKHTEQPVISVASLDQSPYETYETLPRGPDPLDALSGPRRTPWGTLVWSDPDAPAIELFGPPSDDVAGPVAEPAAAPDPWTMPVPRKRGR